MATDLHCPPVSEERSCCDLHKQDCGTATGSEDKHSSSLFEGSAVSRPSWWVRHRDDSHSATQEKPNRYGNAPAKMVDSDVDQTYDIKNETSRPEVEGATVSISSSESRRKELLWEYMRTSRELKALISSLTCSARTWQPLPRRRLFVAMDACECRAHSKSLQ